MMGKPLKLRMSGTQHAELQAHLFPGDGCEAVAVALCGRREGSGTNVLTVHRVVPIPYNQCKVRNAHSVTWSSELLRPLLDEAAKRRMSIIKIHSHPTGYPMFSDTDDASDRDLLPSIATWTESELHASVVMLPGGEMFARCLREDGQFEALDSVAVAGDDICFWHDSAPARRTPDSVRRHSQLFGGGTTARLRELTIGVVGCSGTGSPVIEQLARLGVGRLVLVDPDRVEVKNLNRILNASREDAYLQRFKVDVVASAIARMGFGTELALFRRHLHDRETVLALAECDVLFGCMDGVEGRHLLNQLAAFYLIPYFDLGVKLVADGEGGIDDVSGAVHYLRPDGSSLLGRKVYRMGQVTAEGLKRTDPKAYRDQLAAGYIDGVQEDRPAVISVNMLFAALAVNEFLARFHPYRLDGNQEFAAVRLSLMHGALYRAPDSGPCPTLGKNIGRGDVDPLLGMPSLSRIEEAT
jgi:hypothetical protein